MTRDVLGGGPIATVRPLHCRTDDIVQAEDEATLRPDETDARSRPSETSFTLIPFGQIKASRTRWLVKGLMPATGLATIFGPPKNYKSFLALDLGLHIASGRPWAGRPVLRGVVVYIVGEGYEGFKVRIDANRLAKNYPEDLSFFVIAARPNLGVLGGDSRALIAAIERKVVSLKLPLVAIFIDTLVRTLAGASENDEGMRNFTDNADAIADHFECLAVAVHHTGKDTAKGMRGSSALHGAVVTSWRVEKARDFQARIVLEDAKDGESGLTWTAELARHVIEIDEDGAEVSTLLVQEISSPSPDGSRKTAGSASQKKATASKLHKLFMTSLDVAMAAHSEVAHPIADKPVIRVVSLEKVQNEFFARRGNDSSRDAKRKAFEYNLKMSEKKGAICVASVDGKYVLWPNDQTSGSDHGETEMS